MFLVVVTPATLAQGQEQRVAAWNVAGSRRPRLRPSRPYGAQRAEEQQGHARFQHIDALLLWRYPVQSG